MLFVLCFYTCGGYWQKSLYGPCIPKGQRKSRYQNNPTNYKGKCETGKQIYISVCTYVWIIYRLRRPLEYHFVVIRESFSAVRVRRDLRHWSEPPRVLTVTIYITDQSLQCALGNQQDQVWRLLDGLLKWLSSHDNRKIP